ncbi:MAG TPA: alpha/beta hydrolase [Chloroflexota bacterium]
MTTYVLIGGAWIGAWAWRDVTDALRQKRHQVYPLSLIGLAERVHLATAETNLDTHIADVVNLFEYEDLQDVVLVGHSYAGAVVTGAADRAAERLKALVYCDAGPLPDGQSFLGTGSADGQAALRSTVANQGDGWRLPFPGFPALGEQASISGLDDAARSRMQNKAVAHPFGTWTQPQRLTRTTPANYAQVVIVCEDGRRFLPIVQTMVPNAQIRELDTGHWPMLSKPNELAAILDGIR